MNMGTAIEAAAAANFSSLNQKGNTGAYESVAQRGLINSSTGAVLFTGNISTDFTHLNIFIADVRAGQNTINAQTGGPGNQLATMNGSKFSP